MVLKPCARPPKKPMVLLYMVYEGLANGFKTMCKTNIFFGIVQFFYFSLFCQVGTLHHLPILCCFSGRHFFLRIINFLNFYCFVRQEHYNIFPILGCFCGRHLFWRIINIFIFNGQHLQEERYIMLQDLPHTGMQSASWCNKYIKSTIIYDLRKW